MVKNVLSEVVSVPRTLLRSFMSVFAKMEEILATLEELMNKEGLKRIEESLEEHREKDCAGAEYQPV